VLCAVSQKLCSRPLCGMLLDETEHTSLYTRLATGLSNNCLVCHVFIAFLGIMSVVIEEFFKSKQLTISQINSKAHNTYCEN